MHIVLYTQTIYLLLILITYNSYSILIYYLSIITSTPYFYPINKNRGVYSTMMIYKLYNFKTLHNHPTPHKQTTLNTNQTTHKPYLKCKYSVPS